MHICRCNLICCGYFGAIKHRPMFRTYFDNGNKEVPFKCRHELGKIGTPTLCTPQGRPSRWLCLLLMCIQRYHAKRVQAGIRKMHGLRCLGYPCILRWLSTACTCTQVPLKHIGSHPSTSAAARPLSTTRPGGTGVRTKVYWLFVAILRNSSINELSLLRSTGDSHPGVVGSFTTKGVSFLSANNQKRFSNPGNNLLASSPLCSKINSGIRCFKFGFLLP